MFSERQGRQGEEADLRERGLPLRVRCTHLVGICMEKQEAEGTVMLDEMMDQFRHDMAVIFAVPERYLFGSSSNEADMQVYYTGIEKSMLPFRRAGNRIKNLLIRLWFYKSGKRRRRRPSFARCV